MNEVQGEEAPTRKYGTGAMVLDLFQMAVGALTGAVTGFFYPMMVSRVLHDFDIGHDTEFIRYWGAWVFSFVLVFVGLRLAYRLHGIRSFVVPLAIVFAVVTIYITMIVISLDTGEFRAS